MLFKKDKKFEKKNGKWRKVKLPREALQSWHVSFVGEGDFGREKKKPKAEMWRRDTRIFKYSTDGRTYKLSVNSIKIKGKLKK